MTHHDAGNYKDKHAAGRKVDENIAGAIREKTKNGEIACGDAARIAADLNTTMAEVGIAVDILEVRISKCQLGLFGYKPDKMVVKPAKAVAPGLEALIRDALVNGRIACSASWDIAEKLRISRMDVSSACEAMKIKVKPCQLGAF